MIQAILLAQWRSMRTFSRGGLSAATVVSWISGLLFYGFWAFAAFGAAAFFSNPASRELFAPVLSPALLLILLYWQITPVVTASMGSSLDLKKLLAYPIPHRKLFLVELMLRVTTCLEMPLVLIGIATGLIRNPETGSLLHAPVIVGAVLLFIGLNILLAAAFRNLLERLLRRKRVKEVMMLLLVAISILPQYLISQRFRPKQWDILPNSPYLPWSAIGHLMLGSGYAVPLLTISIALAPAYYLARSQFEISLRFDGSSASPQSAAPVTDRWEKLFRWPARVFPDPIAAIMEKEFRSLLRTSQFRFVFLIGAAMMICLYFPHLIRGGKVGKSFVNQNILTLSSAYSVLMLGSVSYFNCFGFERSAAQAWFSFPVPFRTTMIAKNLAALTFVLVELVFVTCITLIMRVPFTAEKLAESFMVSLISAMYLIAFGNIASVVMPHALSPERINQGGSSKAKNAVILAVFPLVMLPMLLAFWARSVFESSIIFFALLAFAALFGAVLYAIGLDSAVKIGDQRREKILTELSRGDGPISIT